MQKYNKNAEGASDDEIQLRLQQLHDAMRQRIVSTERASQLCPPRPRVITGMLTPDEKQHVAQCRLCDQALVPQRQKTKFFRVAAVAAIILLAIFIKLAGKEPLTVAKAPTSRSAQRDQELVDVVGERSFAHINDTQSRYTALMQVTVREDLDQRRLGIAKIVGPAATEELEKLKLELSQKVKPDTLQELERLKSDLALKVSPFDLVELEKLKVISAEAMPLMVLDFEKVKLETANLLRSSALVTLEHQKAELRQKLPPDVALEIERANLEAGKNCGGKILQFIVTTQVDSMDRLDSQRMRELAAKHALFAKNRMSPRRLREVIQHDYKLAELEVQLASKHPRKRNAPPFTMAHK